MIAFLPLACMLVAVDGDTLRCGSERIRLIGIDAPELPGHCRRGRRCVPGDPMKSKRALAKAIRGVATIERLGVDRYGRTLAAIRVGGRDLSCRQIKSGNATYIRRWDPAQIIFSACGDAISGSSSPP